MASTAEIFDNWKARWVTSILEVYVMKTIAEKERYGGELVTLAQENIDPEIKIPTVYAMLRRQTRDGMLEVSGKKEKDGVTRGTKRKYYHLTESGKQYLEMMEDEVNSLSQLLDTNGGNIE